MNKILKKTLKFRAIGLLVTLAVSFAFTQDTLSSLGITLVQQGIQTIVYYKFEKGDSN